MEDELLDDAKRFPSPSRIVWVTIGFAFLGTLLSQVPILAILSMNDIAAAESTKLFERLSPSMLTLVLGLSQFLSFLLPALAAAYFLFRSDWAKATALIPSPSPRQFLFGLLAFGSTVLLTSQLALFNASLDLNDQLAGIEADVAATLEALIMNPSPFGLVATLIVVGILPALGEELMFRGLLQPAFIRMTTPQIGIWLTALAFGLLHMQFAGVLPRIFLGAVLGFLAYYSQRLWVPIVAHFLFNSIQVLAVRYVEMNTTLQESEMNEYVANPLNSVGLMALALLIAGAGLYFFLPFLTPKIRQKSIS